MHSSQDAALRQLPGDLVEAVEALPVQNTGLYIPKVCLSKRLMSTSLQFAVLGLLCELLSGRLLLLMLYLTPEPKFEV